MKFENVQIIITKVGIVILMFIISLISVKLITLSFDLFEKDKQIKEIQQKYENLTIEYNEIQKNIEVLVNE